MVTQTYRRAQWVAGGILTALIFAGCGGAPESSGFGREPRSGELKSKNGLTANGLTTNGMTTNGMTTNGLTTNGLVSVGFSSLGIAGGSFTSWFKSNPASYSDMVMRYLARCALPAGQSRTFSYHNVTYTWSGVLGLAPLWSLGAPMPLAEQQLVSACLAAHVNEYGVHVQLSLIGYQTNGLQIPVTSAEASTFNQREGCFFGNLFDGSGVYVGYDGYSPLTSTDETSARACAVSGGEPGKCPNLPNLGWCSDFCSGGSEDSPYGTCYLNGHAFPALTTRLQPSDINSCGDGVCQFTESCYDGETGYGCAADCGYCH